MPRADPDPILPDPSHPVESVLDHLVLDASDTCDGSASRLTAIKEEGKQDG
jgi:hypothetical protein